MLAPGRREAQGSPRRRRAPGRQGAAWAILQVRLSPRTGAGRSSPARLPSSPTEIVSIKVPTRPTAPRPQGGGGVSRRPPLPHRRPGPPPASFIPEPFPSRAANGNREAESHRERRRRRCRADARPGRRAPPPPAPGARGSAPRPSPRPVPAAGGRGGVGDRPRPAPPASSRQPGELGTVTLSLGRSSL